MYAYFADIRKFDIVLKISLFRQNERLEAVKENHTL